MTKLILGLFIGAGLAFTILAAIESEERKKQAVYEKLAERMRNLP